MRDELTMFGTVVRAIAQLGRELGMTIVAEGVETERQVDILAELNVDAIQGFLRARPMDGETLVEWLRGRQ